MSGKDNIGSLAGDGVVGAEEAVGEAAVLEEAASDIYVQLAIIVTSINKEIDWKGGFHVGGEVPGCNKGEIWVCRDRLLNALEA